MITPSFSPTATERVLPKLALDFTTASLDPRVTFTRTTDATHPATYINSSGLITLATDNQPRFDYTLNTGGACKGLLIEESRQNIILQSNTFSSASWSKLGGGTGVVPVVTPDAAISPDGTMNASKLEFNKGSGTAGTDYSIMQQATGAITGLGSIYIKADAPVRLMMRVGSTWLTINATTSWQRVNTVSESAASIQIGLRGGYGIAGLPDTATVYLYGAQLEAGAFATSYIPTTSAALTRNADVATMTGTNFSDWYNATEGSIVVKQLTPNSPTSYRTSIDIATATSNRILLQTDNTTKMAYVVVSSGITQVNTTAQTYNNTSTTVAARWKTDAFYYACNAAAPTSDVTGSVPSGLNQMFIGVAINGYYLNGTMQKINYYPQALTYNEIQAFSKG